MTLPFSQFLIKRPIRWSDLFNSSSYYFFHSSDAFCLVHLAEVQNIVFEVLRERRGFVEVNGQNYLTESDLVSLRVRKVADTIEQLYEADYPAHLIVHNYFGNFNVSTEFVVDSILHYEMFKDLVL